jgi:hypothetical protein
MRRVWLVLVLVTACVDVPSGIKANFAEPGPNDRTNYRPGVHGSAQPPSDEPPAVVAKDAAQTTADAGVEGDAQ